MREREQERKRVRERARERRESERESKRESHLMYVLSASLRSSSGTGPSRF